MGTCCSVTEPEPVHRANGATPLPRSARKIVGSETVRRRSMNRPTSAFAGAGGSRGALIQADSRQGSRNTVFTASTSGAHPETLAALSGNPHVAASMESGAPCGVSAGSEPSPLTHRNLELHASLSSTAPPTIFPERTGEEAVPVPAYFPVGNVFDQSLDEPSPTAARRPQSATHRSCPSSVISARQVQALFGSGGDVDVEGGLLFPAEDIMPSFQPLQMPVHLWPSSPRVEAEAD
jgi:hypothetical protein